ncbi:MAG TPA: shikimate kinase [Desulfobacteraceae bacterium]|nr:shikimate kinase [Desulfobacteraceae bacterium]
MALIGFRCSGKTTVGRLLAERLGKNFTDTDELIERMSGMEIHRFVALKGWESFRKIETQALETALAREFQVIATGGGLVLNPENVFRLKRKAIVFWLRASIEVIQRRISRDSERFLRPGLTQNDPVGEVDALLRQRTPLYQNAADHVVDSGNDDPRRVVDTVCRLITTQLSNER